MNIIIATTTSENKKKYTEERIVSYLQNNNIDIANINITAENIYTVNIEVLRGADLIVLIGAAPPNLGVPIIDGTAFIAKIPSMEEETCKKILSVVKEKMNS